MCFFYFIARSIRVLGIIAFIASRAVFNVLNRSVCKMGLVFDHGRHIKCRVLVEKELINRGSLNRYFLTASPIIC